MSEQFVVIGLGSNLGDRLGYFKAAIRQMLQAPQPILVGVSCSEVFESEALLIADSPSNWNIPYFNIAVAGTTCLSPQELLIAIKAIEREIGRKDRGRWAPREIDLDILTYGEEIVAEDDLTIPHKELLNRPFALWPLSALAPHLELLDKNSERKEVIALAKQWAPRRSEVPCRTWLADAKTQAQFSEMARSLNFRIVAGPLKRTELVGIVNVTPDSFSDGGLFNSPQTAAAHARKLYQDGGAILDIGAESTRPGARKISAAEEWQRLEPVLQAIKSEFANDSLKPLISIDTRQAEVAERALTYSPDWLNDVTGFTDPRMRELAAASSVDIVVMHSLGIPPSKLKTLDQNYSAIDQILDWADVQLDSLERDGISRTRAILDPGIGFGKTPQQSFQIISQAEKLLTLGSRVLIGHSRKSFLSLFTDRSFAERDSETSLISAFLADKNIHYLRVHDLSKNVAALNTIWA